MDADFVGASITSNGRIGVCAGFEMVVPPAKSLLLVVRSGDLLSRKERKERVESYDASQFVFKKKERTWFLPVVEPYLFRFLGFLGGNVHFTP